MKLPNFWQFFNLSSDPTIPSLYWDAYSYEERIKKIIDKIWAILRYLKLIMELMNEFDDRLTALEELYNALEARVTELERLVDDILKRLAEVERILHNHENRISELERIIRDLDLDEIKERLNNIDRRLTEIEGAIDTINNRIKAILDNLAGEFSTSSTYTEGNYVIYNDKFYKCNTTISNPGPWNSSNWTQVTVGHELEELKSMIENLDPSSMFNEINNLKNDIQKLLDIIAPEFSTSQNYNKEDYVIRNKKFYRAVTNVTAGDWNPANWTQITVASEFLRIIAMIPSLQDLVDLLVNIIAEEYDSSHSYSAGDYVIHDKYLYKCTGSTTGSWDSTKWTTTLVMNEIKSLNNRVTNVEDEQISLHEYPDAASAKTASAQTGHENWICYVPET